MSSLAELTVVHRFALFNKMIRTETIHAETIGFQSGYLVVMRHISELRAGIQRMLFGLTYNTAMGVDSVLAAQESIAPPLVKFLLF